MVDNPIEVVENGAFLNLESLKEIDLSYSRNLKNINYKAFQGLTNLETLDFYRSGFQSIEENSFVE